MPKKKINWHAHKLHASAVRNNYAGIPGSNSGISSDDYGIFVTCFKGREGKSAMECIDLLEKAAIELGYMEPTLDTTSDDKKEGLDDIEASIAAELEEMKPGKKETGKSSKQLPFRAVKLDIPCVSFIKFVPPSLDSSTPVKFVHHICSVAASSSASNDTSAPHQPHPQQSRYIKRLTPITLVRKTLNPGSLDSLCERVLTPYFRPPPPPPSTPQQQEDSSSSLSETKKYAIRPTIRNNDVLTRDVVIRTVADWIAGVGPRDKAGDEDDDDFKNTEPRGGDAEEETPPRFTVDLKNWDLLVLVEVYRNVVGMSVITSRSYDGELKRYNLAEIYCPTPHPQAPPPPCSNTANTTMKGQEANASVPAPPVATAEKES